MTESNLCETVAESLSRGEPLDGPLAAHAATCPACRDLATAMACLRGAGSAFPRSPDPSLVARVTNAIAAEPMPIAGSSLPLGLPGKALLGLAGLALGVAILTAVLQEPPSPLSSQPGASAAAPSSVASQSMIQASPAAVIDSPGGTASASSAPTNSEDHDGQR